jgi:hypothetical protein
MSIYFKLGILALNLFVSLAVNTLVEYSISAYQIGTKRITVPDMNDGKQTLERVEYDYYEDIAHQERLKLLQYSDGRSEETQCLL